MTSQPSSTRLIEAFKSGGSCPHPSAANSSAASATSSASANRSRQIVQLEAGKITQEALGEVQEMIDICDFAVGCRASSTA
jgi:aldehyde dehydrogenase (NAD+)